MGFIYGGNVCYSLAHNDTDIFNYNCHSLPSGLSGKPNGLNALNFKGDVVQYKLVEGVAYNIEYPYPYGIRISKSKLGDGGYRYITALRKKITELDKIPASDIIGIADSSNIESRTDYSSFYLFPYCDVGYNFGGISNLSSPDVTFIFSNDLDFIGEPYECDGIDISDTFIQPTNPRFHLELLGKNYHGEDITESHLVEFTDDDLEAGYKDIVFTSGFVGVQNCRAYNADYQVCGNGVVTIQGKYINLTDIGLSLLDVALDCIGAATSPLNIASCVKSSFGLLGDIFSSLRNIGTFTFTPCDKFAAFNPDLDFAATSVNYTDDDTVTLTNWLYPVIRVYISAGFEPMTDEDWCCDSYDVTQKSGGSGSITIYPHEPTQPVEPEEPDDSDEDDCICYWLEQIKGKFQIMIEKLDGIRQAILGLKLECNTTVEPCEHNIYNQFEPQITVTPCEPQITVQPGEQQIIVQPAEPQVIVNNEFDLTGIEAELSGIKIGIDNIEFDGDVNVDADGIETKLDEIKTSLDEFSKDMKENLEELGDDILASEPQVHISGDDVETVHGKKVRRSITDADDYARITDDVREDGSSYQPNDNP